MENMEIKNQNENIKQYKFQKSHTFTKITFIVSIISIAFFGIYMGVANYLKLLGLILINSAFLLFALCGSTIGGFAVNKERNVFSILGLILNLIVTALHIIAITLIATSGWDG